MPAPEKPTIMKNLRTMPITSVTLASVNAGTSSHILCKAPDPAFAWVLQAIALFNYLISGCHALTGMPPASSPVSQ